MAWRNVWKCLHWDLRVICIDAACLKIVPFLDFSFFSICHWFLQEGILLQLFLSQPPNDCNLTPLSCASFFHRFTMASASPDNIKQWKFPDGNFMQNLSGHNAIINTLAINEDNVLVSSGTFLSQCTGSTFFVSLTYHSTDLVCFSLGDNGSMYFWDWKSGYNFQRLQSAVQPGSIDSEAGIYASCFDKSGSRLLTCEADKTIKIYKEDESAVSWHSSLPWLIVVNCTLLMNSFL